MTDYNPAASQAAWERDRAQEIWDTEHVLHDRGLDAIQKQLATVVPPRYQDAIPTDPAALAWLEGFLFGEPEGLLLLGATGRGKTHLAYGLIRMLIAAQCGHLYRRVGVIGGSVPTLLSELRPGKQTKIKYTSDGEYYEIDHMQNYKSVSLLFLDDLGAEKASDWTSETLYQIIDHRYNHMLPVIVASNLPPADLAKSIGDRLASRLTEMCQTVVIKGEDRRRLSAA
jgi:DNA replication protein DnaC